jgi:dihydrofolate synthase/folylpolyglutamate synthase
MIRKEYCPEGYWIWSCSVEYRYTYDEVIDKINNARRFGNLPGVEVMETVLDKLGHPQQDIPFIHVAGTNGKGSVCAFLSGILRCAGRKTGTFISPHLIDFGERIAVNGEQIPHETVTRIGNMLLTTEFGVTMTMFDYCLAMALLYFKEQGCDCMVIETGLGGRLDSTNAVGTPAVAVITRIGFDHMAVLGDTLEAIAREKAGIIKPGAPLVVGLQETTVTRVLTEYYERINGKSHRAQENLRLVEQTDVETVRNMKLHMLGAYQWENGAAALLAARIFLGREAQESCIREGMESARWPGRMELLLEEPFLLADGAHNGSGVAALAESLRLLYPGEKFHFIMGVMADKDYETMIGELLPLAVSFVTYTPESSRALQGSRLAECIRQRGVRADEKTRPEEIEASLKPDIKNIAFGSLYFIGDIKKYFQRCRKL